MGDDALSVLSRLSQSSCFPILQTITEARENIPMMDTSSTGITAKTTSSMGSAASISSRRSISSRDRKC